MESLSKVFTKDEMKNATIADISGGNVMNPGVYAIEEVGLEEVPVRPNVNVNTSQDQVILGKVVAKAGENRKTISLQSGSKRFPIGGLGQHPGSLVNKKPASQCALTDIIDWKDKFLAIEERRQDTSMPLPSLDPAGGGRPRYAYKYVISVHNTKEEADKAFADYQASHQA